MKNQKGFTHLFLVVVIVIIGISGILYFSWQKGLIKITSPLDQSNKSLSVEDIPADWETYNTTLFSIKHPSEITVQIGSARNNIAIYGPSVQDTVSQILESKNASDEDIKILPPTTTLIDGKTAHIKRVIQPIAPHFPGINHTIIVIEGVRYFEGGNWLDEGILTINIFIDGDEINALNLSNQIASTIDFNDLENTNEQISLKLNKLEFQIPITWWYEYDKNKWFGNEFYKIEHTSNASPFTYYKGNYIRRSDFDLQFIPNKPDGTNENTEQLSRYPKEYFDKETGYFEWVKESKLNVDGNDATQIELKRNDKVWYNSSSSPGDVQIQVTIVREDGVYQLSGKATTNELRDTFDQILSTFKFLE